jgi:hypothetical protein
LRLFFLFFQLLLFWNSFGTHKQKSRLTKPAFFSRM